jgi:hypothetical protein
MQIDHVIYATADLDAAAARIGSELGLAVVGGGRHEGLGTHNRIVPLAGGFVELLAVADAQEAAASDLGRAVQERIQRLGDGLLGWAAVVDDVAPVAARLGLAVTTIARQGMSAHLAGVAESMREPFLPFFIARDPGVPGPSAHGDAAITWLELAGDPARLAEWLGGADLPVRIKDGPSGVLAVGIGDRVLR